MDHENDPREHVDDREQAAALDPAVGTGTPDTAPHEAPNVTLLAGQPAAVIGSIVVIADGVLASAVPLPEWLTLTLGAVIAVAGILGIRSRVTPVAAPKLDSSTPLTP